MSGDPLMSFDVTRTPVTFNVEGLASNTPYWIKMIDDNGFDVDINSGDGCDFSTLDCDEEYPLDYRIILENDGFYLCDSTTDEKIFENGLEYSVNDSRARNAILSFPIPNQGYGNYISIYNRNGDLLAISEKSTVKN